MNTPAPKSNRRWLRRALTFFFFSVTVCLTPFVVLVLVALSYYGLRGDAAVLREEVFAATPPGWSAKVQVNVGESTLGAAALGLQFVQHEHMEQAREAIAAVKRASVGVYDRKTPLGAWSRSALWAHADHAMENRGWARLVGVAEKNNTVLVYGPQRGVIGQSVDVCVAVINEKDMVITSAKVDVDALDEFVRVNGFGRLPGRSSFLAQK